MGAELAFVRAENHQLTRVYLKTKVVPRGLRGLLKFSAGVVVFSVSINITIRGKFAVSKSRRGPKDCRESSQNHLGLPGQAGEGGRQGQQWRLVRSTFRNLPLMRERAHFLSFLGTFPIGYVS